jgi:hypothetical protein
MQYERVKALIITNYGAMTLVKGKVVPVLN